MTISGDPDYFVGGPALHLAEFSPDGKKFVVVLRKGNLEKNANEFSVLLWHTNGFSESPTPEVVLTMSSSSNRDAIRSVKWLKDNETITFLGEGPGDTRQIYTFDVRTGVLKRITNHPSNLISYSMPSGGDSSAYFAEFPVESIWDEKARRGGIIVSTQPLWTLVAGRKDPGHDDNAQLFFQVKPHTAQQIKTAGTIPRLDPHLISYGTSPSLSPDGKYIVVLTETAEVPAAWKGYSNKWIANAAGKKLRPGMSLPCCRRYELVSTNSLKSRILLDSPFAENESNFYCAPDSHSIVITNTYLPLDDAEGEQLRERQSKIFAVEVQVPSGEFTKVSELKLDSNSGVVSVQWEDRWNELVFGIS